MKSNRSILTIAFLALCAFNQPALTQTPRPGPRQRSWLPSALTPALRCRTPRSMACSPRATGRSTTCSARRRSTPAHRCIPSTPRQARSSTWATLPKRRGKRASRPFRKARATSISSSGGESSISPRTWATTRSRTAWRGWGCRSPATSLIPAATSWRTTWRRGSSRIWRPQRPAQGIIDFSMDTKRGRLYGLTFRTVTSCAMTWRPRT